MQSRQQQEPEHQLQINNDDHEDLGVVNFWEDGMVDLPYMGLISEVVTFLLDILLACQLNSQNCFTPHDSYLNNCFLSITRRKHQCLIEPFYWIKTYLL